MALRPSASVDAWPVATPPSNRETGRRFPSTVIGMPQLGPDAEPHEKIAATKAYDVSSIPTLAAAAPPPPPAGRAAMPSSVLAPGAAHSGPNPAQSGAVAGSYTLREWLARGPHPANDAVKKMAEVAETLRKDRDPSGPLTPVHIQFNNRELSGIAKFVDSDVDALYLAAYSGPDAIQGKFSQSTDVYAIGCMLFEAVTGKQPFRGTTAQEMAKKHATAAAPAVRQVKTDIDLPPALEVEINRSLKKRPGDRHPTLSAFALAVRASVREDDRATMALDSGEAAMLQQLIEGGGAASSASGSRPAVQRGAQPRDSMAIDGGALIPSPPKLRAPPKSILADVPSSASGVRGAQSAPERPSSPEIAKPAEKPAARPAIVFRGVQPIQDEAPAAKSKAPLMLGGGVALLAVLAVGGYLVFGTKAPEPAKVVPVAKAAEPPKPVEKPDAYVAPDVPAAPDIQPELPPEPDIAPDVPPEPTEMKGEPANKLKTRVKVKVEEKVEKKVEKKVDQPKGDRPPVF